MLRVTTIYASSAAASADYYAKYLTQTPGEVPGVWAGKQADDLGLTGDVAHDDLLALLEARDPVSGTPLGRPFSDRYLKDGRVVRAVAGFDATFSAPKSVSVLWALTQDEGFLEAHDTAVSAALAHLDRFGSTTRIRKGHDQLLHADSGGLTMATFRQTTSRADDPDLHTHSVISNKVRTPDGRWLALDAAYLKKHQRMLGGVYQSVLRNELSHQFGFEWEPIVNGQAEIVGVPKDVLRMFSKRTVQVEDALDAKVEYFVERQGREPSEWERAALTREAAVDTRGKKSGTGVTELTSRWADEASALGWTWIDIVDEARRAAADMTDEQRVDNLTAHDVVDQLSADGSVWNRADVMKAICDLKRPVPFQDGERWAASLQRATDAVVQSCVGLDPTEAAGSRRTSDGRSVWVSPIARHMTSERILAEEDFIISWAMEAQDTDPAPSQTVDTGGLDLMQAEVARAVAGRDRLVLAVGPAGAGKTTTLRTAVADLDRDSRPVFGVAPSAKAARVLERETGLPADTLAKLLYEWERPDRPPREQYRLPAGATVLVDEAGMVGTSSLVRLVGLAERNDWRLVLIGDHHQLQAVGRGGMFHELCLTGRAIELDRIHRFYETWEAAASLQLRHGDPLGLDAYFAHDRVVAGPFDDHVRSIAETWLDTTTAGATIAITASTNEHVDKINAAIQRLRIENGEIASATSTSIGGEERAHLGDIVVTRQNDRRLKTSVGEPVRNRESWTVEAIGADGSLTVSSNGGAGQATLPADYASDHVRLGYAATEHGNQGDTVDVSVDLATVATTRRGLYVALTRGRGVNKVLVATDGHDLDEAREVLERVLASDRADVPATTQRRLLAEVDNRPTAQPAKRTVRCVTPSWFSGLRGDVSRQLDAARDELRQERKRFEALHGRLDAAKQDLAQAERALEPFRPGMDSTRGAVEQAQAERWSAHADLRRVGRIKRPAAKREVKRADEALNVAQAKHDEAVGLAAPTSERVHACRIEIRRIKSSMDSQRILNKWDGHEARHDQLVDLDDALTVWHQWATGDSVTDTDLVQAVRTLHSVGDKDRQQQLAVLVDGMNRWVEHVRPELVSQLPVEQQIPTRGLGIEL